MDLQKIGAFLAALRKEQGLTQEALGERIGVTNKTISRWEKGNYLPPAQMLLCLSELYGVSINEILTGRRLETEEYRQMAEENICSALEGSRFSLEERVDYYKRKWRKDHFWSRLLIRVMIWGLLAAGIMTGEILWDIAFVIANVVYYAMDRNRMMIYVEDRAYDGTGR